MPNPLVFVHGYSDKGASWAPWREILRRRLGLNDADIRTCTYVSLNNEVTIKDLAARCKAERMPAVGVTDTGNLFEPHVGGSYRLTKRLAHAFEAEFLAAVGLGGEADGRERIAGVVNDAGLHGSAADVEADEKRGSIMSSICPSFATLPAARRPTNLTSRWMQNLL